MTLNQDPLSLHQTTRIAARRVNFLRRGGPTISARATAGQASEISPTHMDLNPHVFLSVQSPNLEATGDALITAFDVLEEL